MTKLLKPIASIVAIFLTAMVTQLAHAQAENFVDEASAKGIAEIETSRMALKESQSEEVKSFAQKMVDDHTRARQELAQLAQKNNLEMSDEATLMDRAKAWILQWREGENFDQAYANNQVTAHEQTIALYRDYIKEGQDEKLKQFAQKTLPTLEEHLKEAQQLAESVGAEGGQPSGAQQHQREQQQERQEGDQQR